MTRLQFFLLTLATTVLGKVLDWVGKPIVGRNVEDALERHGGHTVLSTSLAWLQERGWGDMLPDGFWWGAFTILSAWGAAEAWAALQRRSIKQAVSTTSVRSPSLNEPYLEKMHILPGRDGPEFIGIPARPCASAQLFLDYEQQNSDRRWVRRARILLSSEKNITVGDWSAVRGRLLTEQFVEGTNVWYWGDAHGQIDRSRLFSNATPFRGRVSFVASDGQPQFHYFHSPVEAQPRTPRAQILDQSLFDFSRDWSDAPDLIAPEQLIIAMVTHYVWLNQAISRAHTGRWGDLKYNRHREWDAETMQRFHNLVEEGICQKAFDGTLPTWKLGTSGLWEPIDSAFWREHVVNYLTALDDDPDKLEIQNRATGATLPSVKIKTSQAAVDRIWPASVAS